MATLLLHIREVLLFCDQAHSFEISKKGEGHLPNKLVLPQGSRPGNRWSQIALTFL